jgi:hypothetical protein
LLRPLIAAARDSNYRQSALTALAAEEQQPDLAAWLHFFLADYTGSLVATAH